MERQLVIFTLANEHYGVDIAAVESIIEMQPITAVPRAPQFVEGITNLRGVILPVVDLHKRFGLEAVETTKKTRIVVVKLDNLLIGMVVDAVTEVLRIAEESVEPLSPIVATVDSTFITGVAKVGNRLVILLDLQRVLSPEERLEAQTLQPVPTEE